MSETAHKFDPTILREYDIRGVVGDTLHVADARARLAADVATHGRLRSYSKYTVITTSFPVGPILATTPFRFVPGAVTNTLSFSPSSLVSSPTETTASSISSELVR